MGVRRQARQSFWIPGVGVVMRDEMMVQEALGDVRCTDATVTLDDALLWTRGVWRVGMLYSWREYSRKATGQRAIVFRRRLDGPREADRAAVKGARINTGRRSWPRSWGAASLPCRVASSGQRDGAGVWYPRTHVSGNDTVRFAAMRCSLSGLYRRRRARD